MSRTFLGDRVRLTQRTGILAVGDTVMILAFVVAGELHHGGNILATLRTFLQFQIGWLIAAIFFGAYAEDSVATWPRALYLAIGTWFVGSLVGQGIRLASSPIAGISVVFVLVALGVGGVLLAGWRLIAWYTMGS